MTFTPFALALMQKSISSPAAKGKSSSNLNPLQKIEVGAIMTHVVPYTRLLRFESVS